MRVHAGKIRELCGRHQRRLATLGISLVACWVAYVAIWGANGMVMYRHKRAEYRELQLRIDAMQAENERLAHENKALRSDPAAVEKEAREQLHYTKPGEVVYVQPQGQPDTPGPATAQNVPHP